ncbi:MULTISPECIES: YciI family protein [Corynebacterium]|uniref:YciI family protein n=1 Tax=Corynebacterium TaxID=1716 RepID=UPI000666089C|nr:MULTISPECIES: YciI family protein [Corynebacterium]MDK8727237.1 YciI family protein [Corynebacterium amycolatum]MDK8793431.1 YciI family protein [Corynebacterium sp. MSK032]MDK8828065.1 YciI family protein [Corynebacterium sp. MSK012]OHR38561.1 hypothetical protein HMPREF2920_03345 [Corynebacterium sp. HMSC075F02]
MQYFFTVHGRRDINAYDSDEEMHAAFERIGRFNQKLQDEGHWVMSGGLVPPEDAMTVLPDGSHSDLPYYNAMTFPSAFWIVQVADEQEAINLAHEAAEACAQAVEMRAIAD